MPSPRRAGPPGPSVLLILLAASSGAWLPAACRPAHPGVAIEQARSLRAAGHPGEAARLLRPLAARLPKNGLLHYELALALHDDGKDADALPEVKRAIDADPSSLDARVLQGEILGMTGRDQEALDVLRRVVAADPKRAGVHRIMGMVHSRAGRRQQAINQFEKELSVHPTDADTLTEIGVFYFDEGRFDDAADRLERAVAAAPGSSRALRYLAEIRFKKQRPKEALDLQRRALAAAPDDVDLLVHHARALTTYAGPDAAHQVLQAAVDRGLVDARIDVELGRVERDRLRSDDAIAHFKRAIEIEPGLADAHFNYGKLLIYLGRTGEAAQELREANRLAPSDPYPYYYLGSIIADEGKTDEALGLFRRSLELDPQNPMAHYALARALQKAGRNAEAEAEFARHAEIIKRVRESKRASVATAE